MIGPSTLDRESAAVGPVLLEVELDANSPTFQAQLEAFTRRASEVLQLQGAKQAVLAHRVRGALLYLAVLPVDAAARSPESSLEMTVIAAEPAAMVESIGHTIAGPGAKPVPRDATQGLSTPAGAGVKSRSRR